MPFCDFPLFPNSKAFHLTAEHQVSLSVEAASPLPFHFPKSKSDCCSLPLLLLLCLLPPPQFQFQLTSKQLPPPRATKSVASSLKGSGVNELLPPPQRCFQAQMNLFRSLLAGSTALGCRCRGACALSALGTAAPHTIPWRRRRRTTTTRNQQIKTSSSLDPAPKWRGGESIGGGRGGHKVKPAKAKAASASPSYSSSSYSDVISLSRIFLLFPIRFSSLPF